MGARLHLFRPLSSNCVAMDYNLAALTTACPSAVPQAFDSTAYCGYEGQTSAKSDSIDSVDLRSAASV